MVSFNYDPLIECAIGTGLLYDWGASGHVFWAELTGDIPAWPPGLAYLGAERADTSGSSQAARVANPANRERRSYSRSANAEASRLRG